MKHGPLLKRLKKALERNTMEEIASALGYKCHSTISLWIKKKHIPMRARHNLCALLNKGKI